MNKNILAYEFILLALFLLPGTAFAAGASKNESSKEKIRIELPQEQSQQQTPKKMEPTKFADEVSGDLKKAQFARTEIRGV